MVREYQRERGRDIQIHRQIKRDNYLHKRKKYYDSRKSLNSPFSSTPLSSSIFFSLFSSSLSLAIVSLFHILPTLPPFLSLYFLPLFLFHPSLHPSSSLPQPWPLSGSGGIDVTRSRLVSLRQSLFHHRRQIMRRHHETVCLPSCVLVECILTLSSCLLCQMERERERENEKNLIIVYLICCVEWKRISVRFG